MSKQAPGQASGMTDKLGAPARPFVKKEGEARVGIPEPRFRVTDYAVLLKPRVMSLVVFTAAVGLLLAPGAPGALGAWNDAVVSSRPQRRGHWARRVRRACRFTVTKVPAPPPAASAASSI